MLTGQEKRLAISQFNPSMSTDGTLQCFEKLFSGKLSRFFALGSNSYWQLELADSFLAWCEA